ncbi:ketopantoate reductase family protein [Pseudomonas sp. HK3]
MHDIYILGSGAMGSLWASYFYPNSSIHFISRHHDNNDYEFTIEPYKTHIKGHILSANTIKASIQSLVVATKAYDALSAINSIKSQLTPDANVVLLQNGLGSQQAIAAAFPKLRLYACSSTEGAYKKDPNTLVHAGKGINIIGALTDAATQQHLQQWMPTTHYQWQDDINHVLWRKFMINCAINPLTAVYNCQNGQLIKQPDYLIHMKHICNEIDNVTQALHYSFDPAFELAKPVCESTAENFSSMLQDQRKGNPTELKYMTGYLLQKAYELNIACPYNQALYDQLNQP